MNREEIEKVCNFNLETMSEEEKDDKYEELREIYKNIIDDSEQDGLSTEKSEFLDEMYGIVTVAMGKIKPW